MKGFRYAVLAIGLMISYQAAAWDCSLPQNANASDCMCNSSHPSKNCPVTKPPETGGGSNSNDNTNNNAQDQGQLQGQAQGQGQAQAAIATSHATGGSASNRTRIGDVGSTSGATSASGGNTTRSSADNSGGNSAVNLDSSDHSSYTDKSHFTVLPDQPAVPMSFSPSANVTATSDDTCGPYQEVISEPVYGYFFGTFKTKKVVLDHNDHLAPPSRHDDGSTMGVRAIFTTSVVNVAGARSVSLGGGSSSGGWGQGTGGASSSMTIMVTHITLRACRMRLDPAPVAVVAVPSVQNDPEDRAVPVVIPAAKKHGRRRTAAAPAMCPVP